MSNLKLISVDFQKDFSSPGGRHYKDRPCVNFIKNTVIPFLRENGIKVGEIVSDYRQPRPGDNDDSCRPGTEGYLSEMPEDVKLKPVWIKCMNSPLWTRENIGVADKEPGLPVQDPKAFTEWLYSIIGRPGEVDIALIGLTLDCCVFCTAQELRFRGYNVKIIEEAVDTYSMASGEKETILNNYPLKNWAKPISWEEAKKLLI
jgi:nicotinamidase-related amidase